MSILAASDRTPVYETTLATLLEGIVHPLRDVRVSDLTQDSRQATQNFGSRS